MKKETSQIIEELTNKICKELDADLNKFTITRKDIQHAVRAGYYSGLHHATACLKKVKKLKAKTI